MDAELADLGDGLKDAAGAPMRLTPGRTWVELVPVGLQPSLRAVDSARRPGRRRNRPGLAQVAARRLVAWLLPQTGIRPARSPHRH